MCVNPFLLSSPCCRRPYTYSIHFCTLSPCVCWDAMLANFLSAYEIVTSALTLTDRDWNFEKCQQKKRAPHFSSICILWINWGDNYVAQKGHDEVKTVPRKWTNLPARLQHHQCPKATWKLAKGMLNDRCQWQRHAKQFPEIKHNISFGNLIRYHNRIYSGNISC